MHHELKITPEFYDLVETDKKTFECRLSDRDYKENDILFFREWAPGSGYTGRKMYKKIKYILAGGRFGLDEFHVCMSITRALKMKCSECQGEGKIKSRIDKDRNIFSVGCPVCEGSGLFYY